MTRRLFLLAPVLCLAGCLVQDESPARGANGGLQLIAVTEDLTARSTTGADASAFDLGDAKGSFQQYFILQNNGDVPLTNIQLSTDNPKLTFTPSSIAVLPPSKGLALLQVVKLNIVHGRRLDAEGWGGLLPAGALEAALNITASSKGSPVTLGGSVTLNAQVMDAEIYNEGQAIGFATPSLHVVGGSVFPVAQAIPVYTPTGKAMIVNTGNVPLVIRRWKSAAAFDSVVVAPGSSYLPEVEDFQTGLTGLELDAGGVVSDAFKFQRVPDGRFFFRVTHPLD